MKEGLRMFKRPHHNRIAHVLHALDAGIFRQNQCYFGGGTAIALRYGEYRESLDIDFLVSSLEAYRELRRILTGPQGLNILIKPEHLSLIQINDIRADQYGIRTRLHVVDQSIKFEIVFEARIEFERPRSRDVICGMTTLTPRDMAASKLLANSDRFADDSSFNRDIIDLAMMRFPLPLLRQARDKAGAAYGSAIRRDLEKCLHRMQSRVGWLEHCMQALAMHHTKAELWQRLRSLKRLF